MTDKENNSYPADITFDDWVKHIFDHPETENAWYWNDGLCTWNEEADPEKALSLVTKLFDNPAFLLESYSPLQIDRGMYYLVSNVCSSYMFTLTNESISWEKRRECIHAMLTLYTDLWRPLYSTLALAVSNEIDPVIPNHTCFMWWDIIPIFGESPVSNIDEFTDAVFYVFENGLKLDSEACLESILHGCGHWHFEVPERVEELVGQFLERADISEELREYAEAARFGVVL